MIDVYAFILFYVNLFVKSYVKKLYTGNLTLDFSYFPDPMRGKARKQCLFSQNRKARGKAPKRGGKPKLYKLAAGPGLEPG